MTREKKILFNYVLYLLFGIIICVIGISRPSASTYYTDYSYHQAYYDNNGSSVSYVTTTWNSSLQSYVSNNITTSAGSYGAGLSISSPIPLIAGHTYSLSLFFVERNNMALSSKNVISVADSVSSAATDYANNVPGTTMLYSNTVNNSILQFVFKVDNTHTVMFIPFTTTTTTTQNYVLTELNIDDLGAEGVSQTDIANSLNLQTTELTNNIELSRDLIIQNQQQLQEYLIESQMACTQTSVSDIETKNKYLDNNGVLQNAGTTGVTKYLSIDKDTKLSMIDNSITNAYACFYDNDKTLISCYFQPYTQVGLITIPNNAKYFRYTANLTSGKPIYKICKNGNQAINDSINDLDSTIKDSDIDNSDAVSFFNDFNDNTHGLSGIISAPLNAINAMLNNQCTPITATWKQKTISFDCGYSFWQRLTGFQSFLNIALDGLLCYRILVKLFQMIEKLKNPNDDRVEVMDL